MGDLARDSLPAPGQTIAGKYEIVRNIGEGGMGVVFEAMHLRLRQRVAIKMLQPHVMKMPDIVARFEREARAAAQLKSRHAARVIDVAETAEGLPYMVMEFLDGHDLAAELDARHSLPIGDAVDCVLQACSAMAEAHANGIIHRDLKPSNLFLCEENEQRVVKVLDFGISKMTRELDVRVTATHASVGTPLYMSPEQVRSAKTVDERTDIWSLGVILFELIAGRPPFDGSATAVAASIVADEPPSLRDVRADVPEGLAEIVRTALAKDPKARFADVQSFAKALAPFTLAASAASGLGGLGRARDVGGPSGGPPRAPFGSSASFASAPTMLQPTPAPVAGEPLQQKPGDASPTATAAGWTKGGADAPRGRRRVAVVVAALAVITVVTGGGVVLTKLLAGGEKTPSAATASTGSNAAVARDATGAGGAGVATSTSTPSAPTAVMPSGSSSPGTNAQTQLTAPAQAASTPLVKSTPSSTSVQPKAAAPTSTQPQAPPTRAAPVATNPTRL